MKSDLQEVSFIFTKKTRISNAQVKSIPQKFQSEGIEKQWIISSQTVLEELSDGEMVIPFDYDFKPFSELGKYIDDANEGVGQYGFIIMIENLHFSLCVVFSLENTSQYNFIVLCSHEQFNNV